jgi:hypothetical protein
METTRHPCHLSFVVIKDSRCYVNGERDQGFDIIPQGDTLRTIADRLIDYCKRQGIDIGGDPPDDKAYNCVRDAYNSTRELKQQKVIQNNNSSNGNGKAVRRQTVQRQAAKDRPEKESYKVMKYTGNGYLSETVLIAGKPYFASYIEGKLELAEEINESSRIIKPSDNAAGEPYNFASRADMQEWINRTLHTDLDRLFKSVYWFVEKFNDADRESKVMLTASIILSHFQDLMPTCHYLFPVGRPGSGKNSMMSTYKHLGYRVVAVSSVTAPNIFNALGTVEDGQITITIDEANNLDEQPELMEVLKTGYKAGGRVPRILDASSKTREQVFYNTYCFKMVAAEHEMSPYKAEGMLSRTFVLRCFAGKPTYVIDKVDKTGKDPVYEELRKKMNTLRKTLFVYRLIHYNDPIPDLRLNLEGREEEICAPLIRLFQNAAVLETIKTTLSNRIREKRQAKADGLECEVYRCARDLVDGHSNNDKQFVELESMVIWDTLRQRLQGEGINDKPLSMMTKAFGEVSRSTMAGILKTRLGATPMRIGNAQSRGFNFDKAKLDKAAVAYDTVDIKILPAHETDGSDALDGYPEETSLD